MDKKTYQVYISLNGIDILVGFLISQIKGRQESAAFQYAQTWLDSPHGFALSPDLPLAPGMFFANDKMFGVFEDCAPDRWGRTLMARYERENTNNPKTLNEIDYIIRVNDFARHGALRFKETDDGEFLTPNGANAIPPMVRLPELLHAADAVLENTDTDNDMALLLAPGSSLGGTRPKASVIDDRGQLCIAKFPKRDDDSRVVAWEAVALDLAKQCCFDVPHFTLRNIKGNDVLIIRRFDRDGINRIPFASAMTMLGATDNDARIYNYTEIADFIIQYGSQPNSDLAELWKRIVFSILISNTDDHLRNHGFLYDGRGWTLSPIYDINPSAYKTDMLHTAIADNNNEATIENALRYAEYFRLDAMKAQQIVNNMKVVVRNWAYTARRYGLSQSDINGMSPAFKV